MTSTPGARRHLWIFVVAALIGLFALGVFSPLRSLLTGGGAYTIEASLYRWGESTREELLPGARVRVDDALGLEIEGSKDLYVYVFNEDERGRHHRLFPVPGLSPTNPLPANMTHVLPGRDIEGQAFWGVDTEGDREQFVVLASPDPLPEIEALLERLPLVGSTAPTAADVDGELMRGIGSLLKLPAADVTTGGVVAQISELVPSEEEANGVWMRRIELISSR